MILSIYDYFIVGYLVILLLLTAYFRREPQDKYKKNLSYIFLFVTCLSIIAFFSIFYLVENHERFLLVYFISSLLILISSILINHFKLKNEK